MLVHVHLLTRFPTILSMVATWSVGCGITSVSISRSCCQRSVYGLRTTVRPDVDCASATLKWLFAVPSNATAARSEWKLPSETALQFGTCLGIHLIHKRYHQRCRNTLDSQKITSATLTPTKFGITPILVHIVSKYTPPAPATQPVKCAFFHSLTDVM